jgi:hypothetical protein
MRTRSQTRREQEVDSSSASFGDHFDTPHAGLAAAFEEQLLQPGSNGYSRPTPFSLDTPLHNGSVSSSTISPVILEGVQGVPRPERLLPFPRRHLIDPRIKRKLDKVLTRFAPVSSSRGGPRSVIFIGGRGLALILLKQVSRNQCGASLSVLLGPNLGISA